MNRGGLLAGLWAASLSAAVIIPAVLLLRTMFQSRVSRRIFCLLWDMALLRLLILTALPSPVSIWRWLPKSFFAFTPETERAVIQGFVTPDDITVNESGIVMPEDVMASSPGLFWDRNEMLMAVWLTVALTLAVWFFWSHWHSRRTYAASLPCEDVFVRDWLALHPLCRRIRVRISDRIAAPLTYGVARPVILLPSGMERTEQTALSCILEHEYQHIRHFDVLRKILLAAVLCLHWFNPLVWVMYVLSNRDTELACDEAVTAQGMDRAEYARTLLSMEEQRGQWGLSGNHFSQNALEERIRFIMKNKRFSLIALIVVLVVMGITVMVFASVMPEDKTITASGQNVFENDDTKNGVTSDAVVVADLMKELETFGISGDADHMTYNGQLIRCFVDGTAVEDDGYAIRYVCVNPDGIVDVHTLRSAILYPDGSYDPMGELIGVAAEGDQHFDQEMIESVLVSETSEAMTETADSDDEVEKELERYQPFGLNYEYSSNRLIMDWNGKPVHSLYDTQLGIWFANNMYGTDLGSEAVDLETIYQDGKLCGLQESQPSHNTIHNIMEASVATGSNEEKGQTFEEIFARYESYGLVYFPRENGMGSLSLNGQAVQSFADLKPDGSTFSYQDPYTENGLRVYTEYDASGNLTGFYAE